MQSDTRKGKPTGDGTRMLGGRGRKPLRVRLPPLPLGNAFRVLTRSCSWESSEPPKLAEWVRILPALLAVCFRGVDWSGFQHGLISRTTPVRIRPPRLFLDGRLGRHVSLTAGARPVAAAVGGRASGSGSSAPGAPRRRPRSG